MSLEYFLFKVFFVAVVAGLTFLCPLYACYEIKKAQRNYEQSQGVFI